MQDKIKKTRSKKDLIISLALLIGGVAMCFSSDSSVIIIGLIAIISGIAAFYTEAFLKGESPTFEYIRGDGLILYVYHNADNTKGYALLKVFVDYDWKEHGGLYKLDANQINQLITL